MLSLLLGRGMVNKAQIETSYESYMRVQDRSQVWKAVLHDEVVTGRGTELLGLTSWILVMTLTSSGGAYDLPAN